MLAIPISSSAAAVFGPTPGSSPGGSEEKRANASSRDSTTNPPGFSASEDTLATRRFGPIPTDAESLVSAWMSATRRRMAACGESRPVSSR
jgi:hypothetical protein